LSRAPAIALLAGLLAGCGGGDAKTVTRTVPAAGAPATRTEVVTSIRNGGRTFNPEAIYKARSPGVVTVISRSGDSSNALGREGQAVGSGFVTDAHGYIATNAHVVTTDANRPADEVFVEFGDGNRLPARVVGTDLNADLALLKVDPAELRGGAAALSPLPLGTTEGLQVGDPVAAIGSPFGEQQSLSVGVVSATNRDIKSLTRFTIAGGIQTDAPINHGNSGGPLLDADGKVIGVNSQIRSTGGGGEGVGFAIPVDTVKRSLAQLRAKGRVDYAYVGISSVTLYPQLADRLGIPVDNGAVVDDVNPGSPAQKAGLRGARDHIEFQGQRDIPAGSDVIVAIDGRELQGSVDLSDALARHEPGDRIALEVLRNGRHRTVRVTLAARPRSQSD
jgi:S1-C subfamily serine protease